MVIEKQFNFFFVFLLIFLTPNLFILNFVIRHIQNYQN